MEICSEEKEYKWFEAAKAYEQVLHSGTVDVPSAMEVWNKIGYCYSLASRQASTVEDYRQLRTLAIRAFEKAVEKLDEVKYPDLAGRRALSLATAEYIRSWLAPNSSEKIKILDKCRFHSEEALKKFKQINKEQEYAQAAIILIRCVFERLYITTKWEEINTLARQALSNLESVLSVLAKAGSNTDLLFVYALGSLQTWYVANICENENDRKDLACKSVSYAEKAIELSKEADNPYAKALSLWAGVYSSLYFTERLDSSHQYAKEMLGIATVVKDNFLMGIAHYLLSHVLDYMVPGEANPDKRKQLYEDILKHAEKGITYLDLVFQDAFIADTYLFPAQAYSAMALEFAVSVTEKRVYSKKALDFGKKSLQYAIRSGAPEAMISALHGLSKAYHYHSNLETKKEFKPQLLRDALGYRKELVRIAKEAFPSNLWTTGVALVYAAEIERDIYRLEQDSKNKASLLQDAIVDIEEGVSFCKNWVASRDLPTLNACVAEYEDTFGGILSEGYFLTSDPSNLQKATKVFQEAAEDFKKVDLPTRVAESYWKIARNLDFVSNFNGAAENFERAFAAYKAAAKKIAKFGDFYLDYALYMKAWSEIATARRSHSEEKYLDAMEHYDRSSQLLRQSKLWMYLSLNFYAWSLLEQAEDFGRKESSKAAIEAFEKAIKFFQESKRILAVKLESIDRHEEREAIKRLIDASSIREDYNRGRIIIEEAKILNRQGEYVASSEKYDKAATTFQKIAMMDSEMAGREAKPMVYLCRAWQKMTLAEARGSPIMYEEAADLFKLAHENSSKESAGLLALGHSNFCKALEAGTEFEITRTMAMYEESSRYIDNAAQYYLQAGFESASEYAKATQRLFDAYVYMDSAKRERDPTKQVRFYSMAEKVLSVAAEAFNKARYQKKAQKVQSLLRMVVEERQLSLSLSEIFHSPTITSTTSSFSTLGMNEEKAIGLERFEEADIQVSIVQHETDVKVGENVSIELQLVNVGKQGVLLSRIENMLPNGFQLVNKPNYCSLEDNHLAVSGMRLEPLKTVEITVVLKSFVKGSIEIKPRIVCVDDFGHQMFFNPEPVLFNVSGASLPGRVPTGYSDLDNLLFGGLPKNYAVILASPSIDERELLVKKFLETGIKKGETTFFVAVDIGNVVSLAEEYQSTFYLFVCNPRADMMVKSLPNVFKLKGVESLTDIDIAMLKAFRLLDSSDKGPRRACITIVSDVLLQHRAVITRKWLSGLLTDLKAKGFTTLVVINPQMHPPEEYQAILGLFEGEIKISERETIKGLDKLLRIRKLYNQRYLENEIFLSREKLET